MQSNIFTYHNDTHGFFQASASLVDKVDELVGETVRGPEWTIRELQAYMSEATDIDYSDLTSRFALILCIADISEHLTDPYYIAQGWDKLHKAIPVG